MRKFSRLRRRAIAGQILNALRYNRDCQLDELAVSLPFVSWAQVFLEVGRLSRNDPGQRTPRRSVHGVGR